MILVTGASGFVGRHLISELISVYGRDHIVALTSLPLTECRYILHHNYQFSKNYFIENGYGHIETIIHAGAFIPKSSQQANNIEQSNSNILNTSLLISSNLPELKKIIYLSTIDIYGNADVISETCKIDPVSLYGDSKLYCEKLIEKWAIANDKIYQILRIGHVYGPGEEEYQKIIPVTIEKLLRNETLQIWGNGEDLRAFIYIKDVVRAIMQSLTLEESIGAINVVSNQNVSIRELVKTLINISKREVEIEYTPTANPVRNLVFDNTKMKKYLLENELPLIEGLKKEWAYMKNKSL